VRLAWNMPGKAKSRERKAESRRTPTNHTRLHLPAVPEAQLLQAGRLQPQAMRAGESTRMGPEIDMVRDKVRDKVVHVPWNT
jgi:hypothetical protein